tara:strand:+ start:3308 stop:4480 length:1173 start_codon:yes stop_codon:yes gene_type:complete
MVSFLNAQNNLGKSDDIARIALTTFIPDNILEETPNARKLFFTKLSQITTRNGMGGSDGSSASRFIISGDVNVLTKDILSGPPTKYLVTIEVTLAVGDGIEGKLFASEYIEFKGSGNSEDKAFLAAIKKINPRHRDVQAVLKAGKEKIIEYYNASCDFILKEANSLAGQKDYDSSIAKLVEVPDVCKECYDKAMDLSIDIFKLKMENECQVNISKSNSLIAQDKWEEAAAPIAAYTPDMSCYTDVKSLFSKIGDHKCSVSLGKAKGAWSKRNSKGAAEALSEISYDSSCYGEAMKLFKSISSSIDDINKRNWDLKYEKYNRDQTIKEIVNDSQMLDADSKRKINALDADSQRRVNEAMVDVEKNRIEAMKAVGVAYGKNQPKSITYKSVF